MEELKRFQGSTFDTIARTKLVEDQDTILELTGKIQELQNEINCMNDSKEFQDAESVRSGNSHVTSQLVSFPPHPNPGGMLSRSIGMPSRKDGPHTHGISGNVFANPTASSSAPSPQELNPWSSNVSGPIHHFQPKQFVKTFGICLCFSHEGCPSHFVRLIVFWFPARLLFVEDVCVRSSNFSRRQATSFINAVLCATIWLQLRPSIQCPIPARQLSSLRLTRTAPLQRRPIVFGCC